MIGHPFKWSTDDHRPNTITGRPAEFRNHAELDARIAARHRKGDAARKGHQTRRKGVGK